MQTYISKSLSELKRITRGQLIGKYGIAIMANLLVSTLEILVISVVSSISEVTNPTTYLLNILISLIIRIFTGIFIFGQTNFFLKIARGQKDLQIKDLFIGFKTSVDKAIGIEAIYTAFVLFSIVPETLVKMGIIPISDKVYPLFSIYMMVLELVITLCVKLFLAFAYCIMADHPEYSFSQILSESVYLMRNKKGRLLLIYLNMIPLFILGFVSLGIGALFATVFFQTLLANFYLDTICEESSHPFDIVDEPEHTIISEPTACSDSTTSDIH